MRLAPLLLIAALTGGCATVKEIHDHPQQARLEKLVAEVAPHTKYPYKHYWMRVADPGKDHIGLAILPQRHIYIAEPLMTTLDDAMLRALIVHAVAHHRLHHYTERDLANTAQKSAFKAGGQFVPGLSNAGHIGGPITESLMGPPQEAGADRKTLVYLHRMGVPLEDFPRALEALADQGYAERIGLTTSRANKLRSRAAKSRRRAKKYSAAPAQ